LNVCSHWPIIQEITGADEPFKELDATGQAPKPKQARKAQTSDAETSALLASVASALSSSDESGKGDAQTKRVKQRPPKTDIMQEIKRARQDAKFQKANSNKAAQI